MKLFIPPGQASQNTPTPHSNNVPQNHEQPMENTAAQDLASLPHVPPETENVSTTAPQILETQPIEPSITPPQLYKYNRGTITNLPPRVRRRPNFLTALLTYFFQIFLMDQSPVASTLLIRDTVIFKDQQQVSISESTWTLVTDVLLQEAGNVVTALDKHLNDLSQVAPKHRKDEATFEKTDAHSAWRDTTSYMAADKIEKRVSLLRRTLNNSQSRLTTYYMSLSGTHRPKRGIINLGGTTLKWLFGLSTEADLQILNNRIETMETRDQTVVHILDQHAYI